MTTFLENLIKEASRELVSSSCDRGDHTWRSVGGRSCPHPEEIGYGRCSQVVYECVVCGEIDYGEIGGPGHSDCMDCKFKHFAENLDFWA